MKEIEDRLGGLLGLAGGHPPARKMAVDIHPGKAIDQRPAGDLDLLEVHGAQLTRRKGLRQRLLGQLDQFGIVAADGDRPVMIEQPAAGDDLEMGRVAHRPAQIGEPQAAKAAKRIAGRRLGQRGLDLGAEPPLRLLRHRLHQGVAARKMPERRPRRDAGAAGGLADADRLRPALLDQLQRGIDQDAPEVAMVIGLWRGRPGRAAARFGGGVGADLAAGRMPSPTITAL